MTAPSLPDDPPVGALPAAAVGFQAAGRPFGNLSGETVQHLVEKRSKAPNLVPVDMREFCQDPQGLGGQAQLRPPLVDLACVPGDKTQLLQPIDQTCRAVRLQ